MRDTRRHALLITLLGGGLAVPAIYFGIQLLCGLILDPDYSFIRQAASELGSDRARHPAIFNAAIMVQGVCTLAATAGYVGALHLLGARLASIIAVCVCLLMNAFQTFWAGFFPMPDPRHGGHPVFIVFMLALPVVLTLVHWRSAPRFARIYFIANLVLLAAMVPLMSGAASIDTSAMRGLLQRLFTLTVFPPIAVGSWLTIGRLRF